MKLITGKLDVKRGKCSRYCLLTFDLGRDSRYEIDTKATKRYVRNTDSEVQIIVRSASMDATGVRKTLLEKFTDSKWFTKNKGNVASTLKGQNEASDRLVEHLLRLHKNEAIQEDEPDFVEITGFYA